VICLANHFKICLENLLMLEMHLIKIAKVSKYLMPNLRKENIVKFGKY